jgi:hypothetical protein
LTKWPSPFSTPKRPPFLRSPWFRAT